VLNEINQKNQTNQTNQIDQINLLLANSNFCGKFLFRACNVKAFMKTIQTEVPEQLYKKALTLIKEGWFSGRERSFC